MAERTRPFTLIEFLEKFPLNSVITFKDSRNKSKYICVFNGIVEDENNTYLIIGNNPYTLHELYAYCSYKHNTLDMYIGFYKAEYKENLDIKDAHFGD